MSKRSTTEISDSPLLIKGKAITEPKTAFDVFCMMLARSKRAIHLTVNSWILKNHSTHVAHDPLSELRLRIGEKCHSIDGAGRHLWMNKTYMGNVVIYQPYIDDAFEQVRLIAPSPIKDWGRFENINELTLSDMLCLSVMSDTKAEWEKSMNRAWERLHP